MHCGPNFNSLKYELKAQIFSLQFYRKFNLKKKKTYLAAPGLGYNMCSLVPQPGIKPKTLVLRAQSLSHWTTREVPHRKLILTIKPQHTCFFP